MKLDWLRADIASARRASALLVLLLAGSMLANVTLAAFAMHMAGRERVVVAYCGWQPVYRLDLAMLR